MSVLTLDPETHTYSDGTDRKWTSVSRVIDSVLKKSFDGVAPEVLANAADRGIKVEQYAAEILRTGGCTRPAGERTDLDSRLEAFYAWYDATNPRLIDYQKIVSDSDDGVAGCLDFLLEIKGKLAIVDLKCTANPEKAWALQLGAYSTYQHSDGCGVLHLNPKFAKGWIWREYEPMIVRSQWQSALAWFRTLQSLKVED